ncbi:MAG: phosphatase PAP2 family protein [Bacteroidales bacterium]|nr:phosphatase PAP2 family protein [Bacteroidales bacterium]
MTASLQAIDTAVFLFFNGLHSHCADVFFYWVSNRFFWIPLYAFLLFLIVKKNKKRSVLIVLLMILGIFLSDQTCNIIKRNVCRPRPSHEITLADKVHLVDYPAGNVYRGGQFGFPSSHAANSIVVALFAIFYAVPKNRRAAALLILWSLLLGYSRIYLGVHYPLDLLAGYAVGITYGVLLFISENSIRKIFCK